MNDKTANTESKVLIVDVGPTCWSYETFLKNTEHLRDKKA
jgi:hypothetical protein